MRAAGNQIQPLANDREKTIFGIYVLFGIVCLSNIGMMSYP
jgi:hypothetical protein